ncbi:MAG: hypothetical protein HYR85_18440 [Planctomycetes bacterium]|nr:hypothetical protein [Planctomycetota bacterium]MBI3829448.1 hypothetical protein [Planctomycetota bacterium]
MARMKKARASGKRRGGAKHPAKAAPSRTRPAKPETGDAIPADEAAQRQHLAKKVDEFRHKHPSLMARVSLLSIFVELQQTFGGEFPEHIAFVHLPDNILNIRRVGRIDIDNMIVGLEVYEMGDIREGILWLPLDYILWVGTTNEPIGAEKIGLESHSASAYSPARSAYEHIRRGLAGLLPAQENRMIEPAEAPKKKTR